MAVLECVPNISEGRDEKVVSEITDAVCKVSGIAVLHVDCGADTNRTVITFAGAPEAVEEGAFQLIRRAAELIDMRLHKGAHPRSGGTDVCPLIPLSGMTMAEAVEVSKRLGARVGAELRIPVYFYEYSATRAERRNLATVRRGEYEALSEKLAQPEWRPDYGPAALNEQAGSVILGARRILVAFNVGLAGNDADAAREIASRIRKARSAQMEGGVAPGEVDLRGVRAIGWFLPEEQSAQISTNVFDLRYSTPASVLRACVLLARECGAKVNGVELIGLLPDAELEALKLAAVDCGVTIPDYSDRQLEGALAKGGLVNTVSEVALTGSSSSRA